MHDASTMTQSYFYQNFQFLAESWWEMSIGNSKVLSQNMAVKHLLPYIFSKKLDCDWIGLSIHFEKWIWIWIVNHIYLMDLDWINNPKESDWATAWYIHARAGITVWLETNVSDIEQCLMSKKQLNKRKMFQALFCNTVL